MPQSTRDTQGYQALQTSPTVPSEVEEETPMKVLVEFGDYQIQQPAPSASPSQVSLCVQHLQYSNCQTAKCQICHKPTEHYTIRRLFPWHPRMPESCCCLSSALGCWWRGFWQGYGTLLPRDSWTATSVCTCPWLVNANLSLHLLLMSLHHLLLLSLHRKSLRVLQVCKWALSYLLGLLSPYIPD